VKYLKDGRCVPDEFGFPDQNEASHRPAHWIQGAIKHPGAETASAKKAGMSVHAYAEKNKGASGTAGKRARLALTLEKLHKK
jgi:hypothetical protein